MYLKIYTTTKTFAISGEYEELRKKALDIQQSQGTYIDIEQDNWIARDKIVAMRIMEFYGGKSENNVTETDDIYRIKEIDY